MLHVKVCGNKSLDGNISMLILAHVSDLALCFVLKQAQEGVQQQMHRKVFVGRCTEDMTADDLRSYFCKFGEVIDVFIPKPFRAFAFVTFADPDIAQSLCGEDHIVKGASVHVSTAAPKADKMGGGGMGGMMGGDRRGGGGYGNMGGGGYGPGGGGGGWGNHHQKGGQNQGNMGNMGNMNNPLGMGGLNLGAAFQLNPAMVAAAQAALGQAGWGLLGGMGGANPNQGGGAGNNSGGGGDAPNNQGGGFGANLGGNSNGGGGFLGWNGQGQGGQGAGDAGSGAPGGWGQPKPSGAWN